MDRAQAGREEAHGTRAGEDERERQAEQRSEGDAGDGEGDRQDHLADKDAGKVGPDEAGAELAEIGPGVERGDVQVGEGGRHQGEPDEAACQRAVAECETRRLHRGAS